MNTPEEKKNNAQEELEARKKEEGEIKDENAEAVTGGFGESCTPRPHGRPAPERKTIA